MSAICIVIKGPSYEEAARQIEQAKSLAGLVELRLDLFDKVDESSLLRLRQQFPIPMIFTLRSYSQGGSKMPEDERLEAIKRLSQLNPEYFDLEYDIAPTFIENIARKHPKVKLIISYHNFIESPTDLEAIFEQMKKLPAFYYKMALKTNCSVGALRLLALAKKSEGKLIAISMDESGQFSRILGACLGSPLTFCTLDDQQQTAPGQFSAKVMIEHYRYPTLNAQTGIYGLIGNPVDKSFSHYSHNHLMKINHFNAVYVKMQTKPEELESFFHIARELSFKGLSVTMPLKGAILPYLDDLDETAKEIGASNTLIFKNQKIIGYNTDGIGALNAIERKTKVKDKQLIIIGAGGAAKAIAYESCRRGARVTILNRHKDKAVQVANQFNCRGESLEFMESCYQEGYDILINATPISMPIDAKYIRPQTLVMDIKNRPKFTELLKAALMKNCQIVFGYEMFVEQALGQFKLWFGDQMNIENSRPILEKKCLECLGL